MSIGNEIWIDRDECMMWYDVKPIHDELKTEVNPEFVAKVVVSDHVYQEYLSHMEDVRVWQDKLSRWYRIAMNERKGEM